MRCSFSCVGRSVLLGASSMARAVASVGRRGVSFVLFAVLEDCFFRGPRGLSCSTTLTPFPFF